MRILVICTLLFSACQITLQKIPPTRPASSAERAMTLDEVVTFTADFVKQRGYFNAQLQKAEQLQPNVWCVRFGLAPKGSGKTFEVYFDGTKRSVLKTSQVDPTRFP